MVLAAVILVMAPVPAHADPGPGWYDAGWKYRKKITIDNTRVYGTSDFPSFPVLISLSSDSDLAADAQDDGDDILFTSSDGTTKLDHEIEYFDGSTGALRAWVEVTTLYYSSDTAIYMYYGNASAANQETATGVWDSSYKGVWHLSEDPSGSPPQMLDSTVNSNGATSSGSMTSGDQVTGKIDGSLELDGTDDYISRPYDSDFDFGTGSFTTSGWFKTGGALGPSTLSIRVNQSSDDAEEAIPSGSMYLTSSDLELVDDAGIQEVGMRFQNIIIPQGTIITGAYIQFTVDEISSGTTNLTIYGEDTDDVSTFTTATNNITGRTKTSANVAWSNVPAWNTVDGTGRVKPWMSVMLPGTFPG